MKFTLKNNAAIVLGLTSTSALVALTITSKRNGKDIFTKEVRECLAPVVGITACTASVLFKVLVLRVAYRVSVRVVKKIKGDKHGPSETPL